MVKRQVQGRFRTRNNDSYIGIVRLSYTCTLENSERFVATKYYSTKKKAIAF